MCCAPLTSAIPPPSRSVSSKLFLSPFLFFLVLQRAPELFPLGPTRTLPVPTFRLQRVLPSRKKLSFMASILRSLEAGCISPRFFNGHRVPYFLTIFLLGRVGVSAVNIGLSGESFKKSKFFRNRAGTPPRYLPCGQHLPRSRSMDGRFACWEVTLILCARRQPRIPLVPTFPSK